MRVPAWVWYVAAAGAGWYAVVKLRAVLRGNRPADENTAYAVANRVLSSDKSSIGSDLYDLLNPGQIDPTAPTGFAVGKDGRTYSTRVNLYSADGVLLRTVPYSEIPAGFVPRPIINKVTGQPVIFRAVQAS